MGGKYGIGFTFWFDWNWNGNDPNLDSRIKARSGTIQDKDSLVLVSSSSAKWFSCLLQSLTLATMMMMMMATRVTRKVRAEASQLITIGLNTGSGSDEGAHNPDGQTIWEVTHVLYHGLYLPGLMRVDTNKHEYMYCYHQMDRQSLYESINSLH